MPQNIRIQVLTVTGKIVKDITKADLGPLHIGRNITEYKWDGTDQYGQKLANGIYLYRVITNQNGNSLEKFNNLMAPRNQLSADNPDRREAALAIKRLDSCSVLLPPQVPGQAKITVTSALKPDQFPQTLCR